jgi:hypothetical protein
MASGRCGALQIRRVARTISASDWSRSMGRPKGCCMAKGAVAKTSTAVPSGSVKQIGQAFDLEGQMLNPRPVRLLRFVPLSTLCRQPRECQRMARGHRGCDEAPNGAPPDGAGNSLIIAAVELDERKGSSGRSRLTNNRLRPWPDGYTSFAAGGSLRL